MMILVSAAASGITSPQSPRVQPMMLQALNVDSVRLSGDESVALALAGRLPIAAPISRFLCSLLPSWYTPKDRKDRGSAKNPDRSDLLKRHLISPTVIELGGAWQSCAAMAWAFSRNKPPPSIAVGDWLSAPYPLPWPASPRQPSASSSGWRSLPKIKGASELGFSVLERLTHEQILGDQFIDLSRGRPLCCYAAIRWPDRQTVRRRSTVDHAVRLWAGRRDWPRRGGGARAEGAHMLRGLAAIGLGKSTYARCGLSVNVERADERAREQRVWIRTPRRWSHVSQGRVEQIRVLGPRHG